MFQFCIRVPLVYHFGGCLSVGSGGRLCRGRGELFAPMEVTLCLLLQFLRCSIPLAAFCKRLHPLEEVPNARTAHAQPACRQPATKFWRCFSIHVYIVLAGCVDQSILFRIKRNIRPHHCCQLTTKTSLERLSHGAWLCLLTQRCIHTAHARHTAPSCT